MRGSDFTDMQKADWILRALRPGLDKPGWAHPSGLGQRAVTGTAETFYNAALNSGARMTCFSERKECQCYRVSRGSWRDLIHGPFARVCTRGIRLCRTPAFLLATHGCLLNFPLSWPWPPSWNEVWNTAKTIVRRSRGNDVCTPRK